MNTEKAYLDREYERALQHERKIEKQSLQDRKEAQHDFYEALTTPGRLHRDASFLLAGHYGHGPLLRAQRILAMSKRANKVAGISQLVAAHGYMCPARHAVAAWKLLSEKRQQAANAEVQKAINEYLEEQES